MDPVAPITHHSELIRRLGPALSPEFDRLELAQSMGLAEPVHGIVFRFTYLDIPFTGEVERNANGAVLRLSGAIGPMPFTIEAPRRRQRALRALAAASVDTALDWCLSPTQELTVSGKIDVPRPMTPAAMVTGAVRLLLASGGYLGLLLEVLGEPDPVTSSAAA